MPLQEPQVTEQTMHIENGDSKSRVAEVRAWSIVPSGDSELVTNWTFLEEDEDPRSVLVKVSEDAFFKLAVENSD